MNRNFHIHIEEKEIKRLISDMKGGKPFLEIDGKYIQDLGFECEPIEGYEKPKDFPNCCPFHEGMLQKTTNWFSKFPSCCNNHKILAKKEWFKKEDYSNRPDKIINCLSFTEYFMSQMIEEENWYKEITDYIEYVFHSFGTPAIGSHLYKIGIENYIRTCKPIDYQFPDEKRKLLIEYFEAQGNLKKQEYPDFNLLYSIFQKWLKSFPDLKYFDKLKQNLIGKIPINLMVHEPKYNPYLKLAIAKPKTKTEFIQLLVNSTKKLLSGIDTTKLLNENFISDKEKYEIDLLSAEHKLKQRQLIIKNSSGRQTQR